MNLKSSCKREEFIWEDILGSETKLRHNRDKKCITGCDKTIHANIKNSIIIKYLALQIAVYMGFNEIFYLGLDLRHEKGNIHFFGKDFHSHNHEQSEFPKMRKMLSYGAEQLKGNNVSIFNCSPVSDLDCFEMVSYAYALSL